MADKSSLRKIKGRVLTPRPEPVPVSRNPEITGGPIYMPVRAGDPDTEIHFMADGELIAVVRLVEINRTPTRVSASFRELSHFAGYGSPAPAPILCTHPEMTLGGRCALCGERVQP